MYMHTEQARYVLARRRGRAPCSRFPSMVPNEKAATARGAPPSALGAAPKTCLAVSGATSSAATSPEPSLLSLPRELLETAVGPSEWLALGMSCRTLRPLLDKPLLLSVKRDALQRCCADLWLSSRALHLFQRRAGPNASNTKEVVDEAMRSTQALEALCRLARMARAERHSRHALLAEAPSRRRHLHVLPFLAAVHTREDFSEDDAGDDLR